jgi:hypothetical protein
MTDAPNEVIAPISIQELAIVRGGDGGCDHRWTCPGKMPDWAVDRVFDSMLTHSNLTGKPS